MIIFLTSFLLMLISGSIFILGFYTITRGEIKVLPNGEHLEEKEIFGDWQLFWEHIEMYRKVFYEGDQLEYKLKILEQLKPTYMDEITFTEKRKSFIFNTPPTLAQIRDIEFALNTNIFVNDIAVFIYDEVPVYRFPEFVRKITNCYVCLSSIGGTFFYWMINYFYPNVFQNTHHPTLFKITFWIIYCVSLAFINKVVKENLDTEKK